MVKKAKPKKPKTKEKAVAPKSSKNDPAEVEVSEQTPAVSVEEPTESTPSIAGPAEGAPSVEASAEPTAAVEVSVEPAPVVEASLKPAPLLETAVEPALAVEVPAEAVATERETEPQSAESEAAAPEVDAVVPGAKPQGIQAVLGVESDEAARVTSENLQKYLDHLKQNIELPVHVTGIKPFGWERQYVWGLWKNQDAYEKSKADNPSYTDTFQLVGFDDFDEIDGILTVAARISDGKQFVLPLVELKAADADSKAGQLFSDYLAWFESYR